MQIWTVGGGKGGTGKSFVTSGLGVCLAEKGHRVVLIDADLGGANLHTYLGVTKPICSLGDFLHAGATLQELLLETPVKGVQLIAGDLNASETDNVTYSQKLKFFRHLKKLDADYVLLDLGAGTRHTTLDMFLQGDRLIAVTVPERMAIENLYVFMKNAYFRRLGELFKASGIKEQAREIWNRREALELRSVSEFTDYLCRNFDAFGALFAQKLGDFKVRVVLNKLREYRQTDTGTAIQSMATKMLGIPTEFTGTVRYDREFWNKLTKEPVHLSRVTAARIMVDLMRITEALLPAACHTTGPGSRNVR